MFSPARWMEPSGIAEGISYLKERGERGRERERERESEIHVDATRYGSPTGKPISEKYMYILYNLLSVVDVAIDKVGGIDARKMAVISKNPKISVGWNDSRLKHFLSNHRGVWVWHNFCVHAS